MDGNVENFGKITFKVKVADVYHDIVLEWSEESQCYGGKQLFKQLASITGIPIEYTIWMQIARVAHPRPASPIFIKNTEAEFFKNQEFSNTLDPHLICNNLVKEVIRCKNELGCDRLVLMPTISNNNKRYYVYYILKTLASVSETECIRGVCHYRISKAMWDAMSSIISNDELNARLRELIGHERDYAEFAQYMDRERSVLMDFNLHQYFYPRCCISLTSRHGHVYLRTRG